MTAQRLKLTLEKGASVSALLLRPENAAACFVFAHGAGAGMAHPFMETVAAGLHDRGIATLRYQFPYMEKGSKRPVPPHARPPWRKPRGAAPDCRWSRAENRSAAA